MKYRFLLILLSLTLPAKALINSVANMTGASASKYKKLEVGIQLNVIVDPSVMNPFDSAIVNMYALFISPTGKRYRRDAFWMIHYSRCHTCPNDVVLQPGDPDYCDKGFRDVSENLNPNDPNAYLKEVSSPYPWRVRFAPPENKSITYLL